MALYNVYWYPLAQREFKHVSYGISSRDEKAEPQEHDVKLDPSLSRTRRLFFDAAFCNIFTLFVTITISPEKVGDRADYTAVCKYVSNVLRLYKRKDKDFIYMLIPEQHDDGSWHLHGLISAPHGLCTPLQVEFRGRDGVLRTVPNKKGYMRWPWFADRVGHFSCSFIRHYGKAVNYCAKYITKALGAGVPKGAQMLLKSKGLYRPQLVFQDGSKPHFPDGVDYGFVRVKWSNDDAESAPNYDCWMKEAVLPEDAFCHPEVVQLSF